MMDYCVIHIDFHLWQVVGTVYDRRINILHVQKKISEKKKRRKTSWPTQIFSTLCQYKIFFILALFYKVKLQFPVLNFTIIICGCLYVASTILEIPGY